MRSPDRHHRSRRDLRAGAGGRRDRDQLDGVRLAREVGHPLARVEERHGQLVHRAVRVLVEQPHRLGGVEHRAAADATSRSGWARSSRATPRMIVSSSGSGSTSLNDLHVIGAELGAHQVDHAASLVGSVGDDHGDLAVEVAQVLQRAGVEVGVRRHPEPLRRRTPVRDRLDVEQLLVVDVLGRGGPAPRAAAQRERRGQVVVDAAERADRGRRVDQDPAGAHRRGVARRRRRRRGRRRPRCGRARRAR